MTAQGRCERATRAYLRALSVKVEDEPVAALAVSMAVQVDAGTSQAGTAAAGKALERALDRVDEVYARRRPGAPQQGDDAGNEIPGDVTPGVTSIVARLRRPS